jgi:hypothetical protein
MDEMPADSTLYATPMDPKDIKDCFFYHAMDLPGIGPIKGEWDLRNNLNAYLGNINVAGKRVLDVGTASGYLCFEMEKRGADVVGYDLSEKDDWDIVPYNAGLVTELVERRHRKIRRLNNAWWYVHRTLNSKARMVYGSVYNIPEEIGPVDISVFGSILVHLRDPFQALYRAARITTESIVVTDLMPAPKPISKRYSWIFPFLPGQMRNRITEQLTPALQFVPNVSMPSRYESWWILSPQMVIQFLGVLGFTETRVNYHQQQFGTSIVKLFTVVGNKPGSQSS